MFRLLGREVKQESKLSSVALNYANRTKDELEKKIEYKGDYDHTDDESHSQRESVFTTSSSPSFFERSSSFFRTVHVDVPAVSKTFISF
jgi:hypothetical protein